MGYFHKSKLLSMAALTAMPLLPSASLAAQNFGMAVITQKKVVLERKLPPTGHIAGTAIKVVVTAHGLQADLATDLKSTLENILLRSDSRLRSAEGAADTVITCTITSYSQPQPQATTQSSLAANKDPLQKQALERVTGFLTVGFKATDTHSGRTLSSDNVHAKFDEEFSASGADKGIMHSVTHTMKHLTKGGQDEDTPPTPVELHDKLIQDAAQQIASHLVNTTEQVEIYLARGGDLSEPVKLAENKLWTRSLESLEMMKPFPKPEEDAYRLYDIGVANEALAYQTEDVNQARKYLQEAAINYGKAIDGKPTEKYFLAPQTRIDTALAHYKALSTQAAAPADTPSTASTTARKTTKPAKTTFP